jgi:hypothetical protein
MKRLRGFSVLAGALLLFAVVLWLIWPASQAGQAVSLLTLANYTQQASNLSSCMVTNTGPRAILLTDLIVETEVAKGWRGYSHTVPSHPQRLDVGETKEITAGVPVDEGRWRLRVAYGTDVKGPTLALGKAAYAITHFRLTGPGFGIMAGSNTVASGSFPIRTKATVFEPEIIGSERFSNQVQQAIALLKSQDGEAYQILTNYVGRIQEAERSGMWAYRKPPTYEMSDSTAYYSLTWCAATIAHDSFHSKLYHDYQSSHTNPVPDRVWTGTNAEQRCMKYQLQVMERIGSSKAEMDYAREKADGNYVKDQETWEDYKRHKW